jgi:dihydroxyacetone kinase-like protein
MQAVVAKLDGAPPADVGAALKTVGMTLISTVGGSGGPLYGSFFMQAGNALAGETELTPQELVRALEAGVAGVMKIGKSTTGEKTMLDTLVPAVDALRAAVDGGASLGDALAAACEAGQSGMEATIPMLATKGRASYLGERSIGHQDPGATSSNLLLRTLAESLG